MANNERSEKSYGVAVSIAGVFGMLGFQHFYLGRYLHGLIDLSMSIGGVCLIIFADSIEGILVGAGLLGIDAVHSIYVFYKLLVGEYLDGEGKLVAYPGQKTKQQTY